MHTYTQETYKIPRGGSRPGPKAPGPARLRTFAESFFNSSDGGRRSRSEGALGLALFSVTGMDAAPIKNTLLVRKGQLLEDVDSSFLAEAAALEWALQYLIELLRGSAAVAQQQ